jgi:glycosyltransferase involved in cell wall biosynthesis
MRAAARILVLTPDLRTVGGVENYYQALDLPDHDRRIDYFFVTSPTQQSAISTAWRLLRNYVRFWSRLPQYQLVVINPSLNPHSYYRDAVFCWLTMLRKRLIVVFFRGWSENMEAQIARRGFAQRVFRRTFGKVGNFIVLGRVFREKLLRLGASASSRFWIESTVANDDRLPAFSIEQKLADTKPLRVLFMARLVASKGAQTAIDAFAMAQRRLPDVELELIMAGDGPERDRLMQCVHEQSIRGVHFPGVVRGAERDRLLVSSHILLFPTMHGEGMPNVILEAMLYGMAIVTRRVGGVPDAVIDGENGFLTDDTGPAYFAEQLQRLATDRQLRTRMAGNNHAKARDLYTSAHVRARIVGIVNSVLAGTAAGSSAMDAHATTRSKGSRENG